MRLCGCRGGKVFNVRIQKKGRQQVKRPGGQHCCPLTVSDRQSGLAYKCVEQMDGPARQPPKEDTQVGRKGPGKQAQEG